MMDPSSQRGRLHTLSACAIAAGLLIMCAQSLVAQNSTEIRFENRQPHSGVNFLLNNGTTSDKPIVDSIPGGVALLDYDNDGFLDVFFTNGAQIPTLSKENPSFYN